MFSPHSTPGGSPSDRGCAGPSASASASGSEVTLARCLSGLRVQGDDDTASLQPAAASKKKKRGPSAGGSDKNGCGLRQLSIRVRDLVESKGRTTCNEVANEMVAEFLNPNINIDYLDPDNPSLDDEKNIRRRVYDALNVLEAMEIISKDKKEIHWRGLPMTSMNDMEELKTEAIRLKCRIEKKNAYLQDLKDQYACLQNLVRRNEQLSGSGDAPSSQLALPFLLVQTSPDATVEVEMSEDMQLLHFDFNSTPFELHDGSDVLKAMGLSGKERKIDCTQAPVVNVGECSSSTPNKVKRGVRIPISPPIPGIIKGE